MLVFGAVCTPENCSKPYVLRQTAPSSLRQCILRHTAPYCAILRHTAPHCAILRQTARSHMVSKLLCINRVSCGWGKCNQSHNHVECHLLFSHSRLIVTRAAAIVAFTVGTHLDGVLISSVWVHWSLMVWVGASVDFAPCRYARLASCSSPY